MHFYDHQVVDLIRQLPIDAVYIDVGVNEGQLLQHARKHCIRGRIIGFEPIPYLAKVARLAFGSSNVEIQEIALSDESGEKLFYHFPKRNAISGLSSRNFDNNEQCETFLTQVELLDDRFGLPRLDLIKIDVEGAEVKVLKGAINTIKTLRPKIVFESGIGGLDHFGHTPEDIWELLTPLGYRLSTVYFYLAQKKPFSKLAFVENFQKGHDYQYIAY